MSRAATAWRSVTRLPADPEAAWKRQLLLLAALAVLSRLVLLVVGEAWLAGPLTDHVREGRFVDDLGSHDGQLDRLGLGDPRFYRDIKDHGYAERPFTSTPQENWAFFPAWPYLWRGVDAVLPADLGAALANTALFALACVLVALAVRAFAGERVALVTGWLLIALPGAQFTVRPGPESLFLAASAAAVWAAAERRWAWVLPAAVLATMCRPQGALLLVPLVVLAAGQLRGPREGRPNPAVVLAALAAPVLALGALAWHMDRLTGNALAPLDVQEAWDNDLAAPGEAAARAVVHLLRDGDLLDYYDFNLVPLSLLALGTALGLTAWSVRRRTLPPALLAYVVVSLLVLLTRSQTQASLRYLVVVFPLVAVGAQLLATRRYLLPLVLGALLVGQLACYLAAMQGLEWALT